MTQSRVCSISWLMYKLQLRNHQVRIICTWLQYPVRIDILSPIVLFISIQTLISKPRRTESLKWPQQHPPVRSHWRRLPSIRASRTLTKPSTATKAIWTFTAARRWRARATKCANILSTCTVTCAQMLGLKSGTISAGRARLLAKSKTVGAFSSFCTFSYQSPLYWLRSKFTIIVNSIGHSAEN